jgi:dCMP deaminase
MMQYDDKFDEMDARLKQRKRDHAYVSLAMFWAETKSKDPSTQVGAVLVSADGKREYLGYNGFPRGVEDHPERYADRASKYAYVVHAELNAILKAGRDSEGATLYTWPLATCNECAKAVIQAGVARVVSPTIPNGRWQDSQDIAMIMYNEAGVVVDII